jgi:hypothetical protein
MRTADACRRRGSPPRVLLAALSAVALFATAVVPAIAAPSKERPSTAATAAAPKPARKPATFGIGPANVKKLDGRSTLNYLASPGAHLTDHVAIVNLATKQVTLNLYSADATVGADGTFGYLAKAAPHKDAAAWITPATPGGRSAITLGPRATKIVPLTVSIPADASPGDHTAGVITSLTSKVKSDKGELVDFEQRVALRASIRVSGPLHPALTVEDLQAHYGGTANPIGSGTVTVTYRVHNTGNVRLGARQKVIVSGLFGADEPAKTLADVPLLLPKSVVIMSVTVPDVFPQLRLRARVVLFPLKVEGDVDPGLPNQISATTSVWAIPWALIIILASLLVLALGAWAWTRRRRRQLPGPRGGGRHRGGPNPPDGPDSPDGRQGDSDSAISPQPEGVPA